MTRVVLDSNIFDELAIDAVARQRLAELSAAGEIEVVVPDTLHQELLRSPFRGVPDWFPTTMIADSVFVLDHSRLGFARLGPGEVFTDHRGQSKKTSDAVLADVAHLYADLFVSEDKRARRRYSAIGGDQRAMNYAAFRATILKLRLLRLTRSCSRRLLRSRG